MGFDMAAHGFTRFDTPTELCGMARRFGAAIGAMLGGSARQQNDSSTARDLNAAKRGLALPPGLSLRWLGTAGFALGCEDTLLLIDPYLTRASLRRVLSPKALEVDLGLVRELIPSASAVLVGHTHFDHALDVPAISQLRGCPVYGSRSLAHLMGLHGLAARAVAVETGRVYEIGPFEVTFIESLHSRLALGLAVPASGELTCDHLDGLRGNRYRCGQVYGIHVRVAGASFYHLGSANLIEDRIPFQRVDFLLAGIAGRVFTRGYTARVLRALSPAVVIPQHFDDLFSPLGAPMGFSFNVNLGGFVEDVGRVSREFAVRTLEPLQAVSG